MPCGRHRSWYAASARCGKVLNGAFCCHGCHILLHAVVLYFFCPHPGALSVASDFSVTESAVQGNLFSQRKTYLSHPRAGGNRGSLLCSHKARPLPAPGDSLWPWVGPCSAAGLCPASLQTQQLSQHPHWDWPRGDAHWTSDTRNGSSALKSPRLPRARQPAGQPLPRETQQHKPTASQSRASVPWGPRDLGTQSQGRAQARPLVHLGECSCHTSVPCRHGRLLGVNIYKMYTYFL